MTPKDGKACTPTEPPEPKDAFEADAAEPGAVSEAKARDLETQSGKYGTAQTKTFKPPEAEEEDQEEKTWIEIELHDMDGNPVPGERYKITLPDGSVTEGTLDGKGFARVDGIDPGNCDVTFPDKDESGWESKDS